MTQAPTDTNTDLPVLAKDRHYLYRLEQDIRRLSNGKVDERKQSELYQDIYPQLWWVLKNKSIVISLKREKISLKMLQKSWNSDKNKGFFYIIRKHFF